MNLINKIINVLGERRNRKNIEENIMILKKYPYSVPNLVIATIKYWDVCKDERIMKEAIDLFRAYKNTFEDNSSALLPHEYAKIQRLIITIENILEEKGMETI